MSGTVVRHSTTENNEDHPDGGDMDQLQGDSIDTDEEGTAPITNSPETVETSKAEQRPIATTRSGRASRPPAWLN